MVGLKRKKARGASSALLYCLCGGPGFDAEQAERLASIEKSLFLPFTFEAKENGDSEFSFDIGRLIPFTDWAGKPRSVREINALFRDINWMFNACWDNRIQIHTVQLDTDSVFYDSWMQSFRFICLPVNDSMNSGSWAVDIQRSISSLFSLLSPADEEAMREKKRMQSQAAFEILDGCFSKDPSLAGSISEEKKSFIPEKERVVSSKPLSAKKKQYPWEREEDPNASCDAGIDSLDCARIVDRPKSKLDNDSLAFPDSEDETPKGTVVLGMEGYGGIEDEPLGTTVLGMFDDSPDGRPSDPDDRGTRDLLHEQSAIDGEEHDPLATTSLEEPDCDSPIEGHDSETAQPSVSFILTRLKTNERIALPKGRFMVGKSVHSDYRIAGNTTISRLHAVLLQEGDACWIEDNKSLNGTFVNGLKIAPANRMELKPGDLVRMSDEDFLFELASGTEGGR